MTPEAAFDLPADLPGEVAVWLARLAVGPPGRLTARRVGGGLSIARVYRVEAGGRLFALRDWGWPPSRLPQVEAIIGFQGFLSRCWPEGERSPAPRPLEDWAAGHAVAPAGGSLWTLSDWLPGEPLRCEGFPPAEVLEQLAIALADMHAMAAEYDRGGEQTPGGAGWTERAERLRGAAAAAERLHGECQRLLRSGPAAAAMARAVDTLDRMRDAGGLERLRRLAEAEAVSPRPVLWIVRDGHCGNWLFERGRLSGVADFAAARLDWPVWDLVRLLTSWRGDANIDLRQFTSAYRSRLASRLSSAGSTAGEAAKQSLLRSVDDEVERWLGPQRWRELDAIQSSLSLLQWCRWAVQSRVAAETIAERLAFWTDRCQRLG